MPKRSRALPFIEHAVTALLVLPVLTGVAEAQSAEDFFRKAEKLTVYVGSSAGAGYDQIARLVGRNLSRFLPGHPPFVFEYMPTAVGIQATNFLYNSAPRDGSVILADANSALALPIYGSSVAHYDPRKFEWIGSTGKQQAICVTWKASGIATLEDAKKRTVNVAANAVNAGPGVYPMILNSLFGTKFKVIPGYAGGAMELAVERGEVDGICGFAWQTYQAIGSTWFNEKKAMILVQMGREKNPDLPDVPLARDLLSASDQAMLDLIVLPQEFGRPFIAPPDVPADRMAIYRQAFQEMVKDSQFLSEAREQKIAIEALNDREIESLLAHAYKTPKPVMDRAAVFAAQMN